MGCGRIPKGLKARAARNENEEMQPCTDRSADGLHFAAWRHLSMQNRHTPWRERGTTKVNCGWMNGGPDGNYFIRVADCRNVDRGFGETCVMLERWCSIPRALCSPNTLSAVLLTARYGQLHEHSFWERGTLELRFVGKGLRRGGRDAGEVGDLRRHRRSGQRPRAGGLVGVGDPAASLVRRPLLGTGTPGARLGSDLIEPRGTMDLTFHRQNTSKPYLRRALSELQVCVHCLCLYIHRPCVVVASFARAIGMERLDVAHSRAV